MAEAAVTTTTSDVGTEQIQSKDFIWGRTLKRQKWALGASREWGPETLSPVGSQGTKPSEAERVSMNENTI
jgi:hypothetical protein